MVGKTAEGNPSPKSIEWLGKAAVKGKPAEANREETQHAQRHYSVRSRSANLEGAMKKKRKRSPPMLVTHPAPSEHSRK